MTCGLVLPQGNGGAEAPSTEEGLDDVAGGMYVRFDAPKAKIRKSWPGLRGTTPTLRRRLDFGRAADQKFNFIALSIDLGLQSRAAS